MPVFEYPRGQPTVSSNPIRVHPTLNRQSNSVGLGLHDSAQFARRIGDRLEYRRVNGKSGLSLTLPSVLTSDPLGKRRIGQ